MQNHVSASQAELILENLPEAAVFLDRELRYTYVNRMAECLFGLNREEIIGKAISETFPEAIDPQFNLAAREAVAENRSRRLVAFHQSANSWIESNFYPTESGLTILSKKVSERRRASETLREGERDLSKVMDAIPQQVWSGLPDGFIDYCNHRWLEYTGLTLEQARGHGWMSALHSDDAERVLNVWNSAARTGELYEVEERLRGKDGQYRWFLARGLPVRDEQGAVIRWYGTNTDIEDRKQAEQELRRSEERINKAFQCSPNPIAITREEDGEILQVNDRWTRLFGYTSEEVLGKTHVQLDLFIDNADRQRMIDELQQQGSVRDFQVNMRSRSGRPCFLLISIERLELSEERFLFVVGRDVTEHKKSEAALRQSEERSRELFENANDIIYTLDLTGNVTSINRAGERITGYQRTELLNRNIGHLINPDYLMKMQEMLARKVSGEPVTTYELEIITKTGQRVRLEVSSRLIHEAGTPAGIQGIARDITERKALEQEREQLLAQLESERARLEAVLWQMPAGVVIAEAPSGKLILGNKQAEVITRHPFVAADGFDEYKNFAHLFPVESDAIKGYPLVRALNGGEIIQGEEMPFVRGDGSAGVLSVSAAPIRDKNNEIVAAVTTFHDITEQKRAEEERAMLLKREQAARSEAEAANRLKDEFLATVSHELRTPLTSMLGWSHLLRTRRLSEEAAARAIETIERNAQAQSQLVNDLLDVSRIITGKLRLEAHSVELVPIIEAAIDVARPTAGAKSITIESRLDPAVGPIFGDPTRLQQVIWNLLSNALKFTPSRGAITVSLDQSMDSAMIKVGDTGQGISAEFLPYVFERFRQGDASSTRHHGGLGLGLSIVRHLVEMHGGTVGAESAGQGCGATFWVKLPLNQNLDKTAEGEQGLAAVSDAHAGRQAELLEGVNVLIVDDEADTREWLLAALSLHGATATAVGSVDEAIVSLELIRPDALISDIGMPGADGFELIRRIRALPGESGGLIPAIALTAYAGEHDKRQALEAGYQFHLAKPAAAGVIAAALAELLTLNRSSNGSG